MRSTGAAILGWIAALFSGGALAHAVLVGSTPPDRALLDAPPREVRLLFNEPVRVLAARVLAPGGRDLAAASRAEDQSLLIALGEALPQGTHLVSYRIVSADSHPVSGSITFSVGRRDAYPPEPDAAPSDEGRAWAGSLAPPLRALYLACLFAAVGGALFAATLARQAALPGAAALIRASALLAALLALAGIGLQGASLAGGGLESMAGGAAWRLALESTRGQALALSLAALLAAALSTAFAGLPRAVLALTGFALAVFCLTHSGHAAIASPRAAAVSAWAVHVAVAAFWLGSLAPLAFALRLPPAQANGLVARFSRAASIAVPLLLAAGVVMTALLLDLPDKLRQGAYDDLMQGRYGLLLGLKLALVAVLLALAAWNRQRLAARIADDPDARRALRRNIGIEILLGIAILAATAQLASTEPRARVAAVPAPGSGAARLSAGEFVVEIEARPVGGGARRVWLRLLHDGVHVWTPLEVALELANARAGIEPLRRAMKALPDGSYEVDLEALPVGGPWEVRVDALMTEFSKQTFEGSIMLP